MRYFYTLAFLFVPAQIDRFMSVHMQCSITVALTLYRYMRNFPEVLLCEHSLANRLHAIHTVLERKSGLAVRIIILRAV